MIAIVKRQMVCKLRVDAFPPGLISPMSVNMLRACFREQRQQDICRPAPSQDQTAATFLKGLPQLGKAVMQPPALGAAHLVRTGRFIIQNENRHNLPSADRRAQRRVIMQPKILTKPEQRESQSLNRSQIDGSLISPTSTLPNIPKGAGITSRN